MNKRANGILLHITSLPTKYGIGDLGPAAYKFADFLHKAKQKFWQILPLTLPNKGKNWSPYDCLSAFAGNTLLISPQLLYEDGLLRKSDIQETVNFSDEQVQYEKVYNYKMKLLNKTYDNFKSRGDKEKYEQFCDENKYWLIYHSLFTVFAKKFKTSYWPKWPKQIITEEIKQDVQREKILQYLFFKQWFSLKKFCGNLGISIIGDIPIYVAYQSSDVWKHQDVFKLARNKKPKFISGVPPDYFSRTGQLWGNPIYDWQQIKRSGYEWWMERLNHNLKLFDIVRIDHFRGLVKFWQVPARHKTAVNGKWMQGPGEDFFKVLFKKFPNAQIIAEDLGFITPDVKQLRDKFGLMGMKVLLFAFNDCSGKSIHLPHNYIENCIVYTGTHDNNTVRGWFETEAGENQKESLWAYLGKKVSVKELPWEMIRFVMRSVARISIVPVQDILGLPAEARMNRPAQTKGNWRWRLKDGLITDRLAKKLARMTEVYGRGFY